MKKVLTIALFASVLPLAVYANISTAQMRGIKTYQHPAYGPTGKYEVKEFHHTTSQKPAVLKLQGVKHLAVNRDAPGMMWLNRNTRGDIYVNAAHVFHGETGKHLGLSELHPGFYHLNYTDYNAVLNMPGYQQAKKELGDHLQLVKPTQPGGFVGVKIVN